MSIYTALREYRSEHPKTQAEKLARRFLLDWPEEDLVALIRDEIERIDRAEVRGVEIGVYNGLAEASQVGEKTRAGSDDWWTKLKGQTYRLGDGTKELWERMTESQHRARASMLRAHAMGTIRTAELHEQAADLLRTTGAPCLAEVQELAAA